MCGHIWIVSLPTWRLALAHKIPQGEAQEWHRSGTGRRAPGAQMALRWRSAMHALCVHWATDCPRWRDHQHRRHRSARRPNLLRLLKSNHHLEPDTAQGSTRFERSNGKDWKRHNLQRPRPQLAGGFPSCFRYEWLTCAGHMCPNPPSHLNSHDDKWEEPVVMLNIVWCLKLH